MKIILSRKGFDSSSGGGPSPIINGVPVSLPIPAGAQRPGTCYADLGLADHVAQASKGKLNGQSLAHHDPLFLEDGTCAFGQCGAAQSHLENMGVGRGDLFVFFGLFREGSGPAHHRIFGWLFVDQMVRHGDADMGELAALGHPHALAAHGSNDVIWRGQGTTARSAHPELRLSAAGGPASLWRVPAWLERHGLSYHARPDRWRGGGLLQSVARGQEFVCDAGDDGEAHEWAHRVLALMD